MPVKKFKNDSAPYINEDTLNNNFSYCVPTGGMLTFAGSTAPEGWLLCDGSEVSKETYSDLFAVIGNAYGTAQSENNFVLPKTSGRTIVGLDPDDTDFNAIGKIGGEKKHTLTIAEMPSHNHQMPGDNGSGSQYTLDYMSGRNRVYETDIYSESKGGNQSHNNMPPFIVGNYIIKY